MCRPHTIHVAQVLITLTCLPICKGNIDSFELALVTEKLACMQGVPRCSQDSLKRGAPDDAGYGAGLRPPHGHPEGGGL